MSGELVLSDRAAVELCDQAEAALSRVEHPDDADDLWRKVKAVEEAARLARVSEVTVLALRRVQLRAKRRYGELLGPAEQKAPPPGGVSTGNATPTAERIQAHKARKLASVPAPVFEEQLAAESVEAISEAGIIRAAKREERPAPPPAPAFTEDKFPVLYADPPWRYEGAETSSREIENQYPTMALDEIKALKVPAADDAVLYLWTTSPKLAESLEVIDAWGFEYRTSAVWVKDRIGMGYYFRQQHELLLVAKRGKLPVPDPSNRPSSVVEAPRGQHSAKPVEVYELLEGMYPDLPRVELFARSAREGWTAWGNQVPA